MARAFGLRTEIILHMTMLLGAALLFGGFLILKLTERELLDQRVASLNITAEILGSTLGDMLGSGSEADILRQRTAPLFEHLPQETAAGVWRWTGTDLDPMVLQDAAGVGFDSAQRLASVRSLQGSQCLLSYSQAWFSSVDAVPSYYKITRALYDRGNFVGVLQMRFPLNGIGLRVRASLKILVAYVFLYGAVLFLFGLYQLNRNVSGPVRKLMASTRAVAGGNLEEKVSEEGPAESLLWRAPSILCSRPCATVADALTNISGRCSRPTGRSRRPAMRCCVRKRWPPSGILPRVWPMNSAIPCRP